MTDERDLAADMRRSERLRCVGLVLSHVGQHRIAGRAAVAAALDALATEMEHGVTEAAPAGDLAGYVSETRS